ncbi:MAG: hypothetical protein EOO91_14115 [Pedobacter sp.]|nr:MAG: hypothetical protein EOO91_14115 [Pedobacter sp.]
MKKKRSNYIRLLPCENLRLYLLLTFVIAIIIGSCKKDSNFSAKEPTIDVSNLKLWYNQILPTIENKDNWLNRLSPNWETIQYFDNNLERIYEIDLNNPDKIFAAANEVDVKKIELFESRSLLKLIIFENKLDNKLNAAIMELVAFERNTVELEQLHYKSYQTFSGAVNFYEVNGQLANGWLYTNGKIIAKAGKEVDLSKISLDNNAVTAKGKVMLAAAGGIECGTRSVPHWRQECTTIGGSDGNGWGYDGGVVVTTCRWEVYHTTEIIYCPTLDDGSSGGGGGGYTGGGSGGGSSNPPTDPPPADPDCGKVKQQTSTTAYKEKATDLKGKTSLTKETGFEEKKDGSFSEASNSGDNSLSANPDANTKGFIHTHLNDYQKGDANPDGTITMIYPIRMLSPGDVNTLMNIINQNINNGDFSSYYVSMVSSYGHYMIKFSGTSTDVKTGFGGEDWANKYRDFMKGYVDLERGFLRFLKEKNGTEWCEAI